MASLSIGDDTHKGYWPCCDGMSGRSATWTGVACQQVIRQKPFHYRSILRHLAWSAWPTFHYWVAHASA